MSDLIKLVGGIKRAREIVEGAPANINYRFYSLNVGNGNSGWHVDFRSDCIDLIDLRTAIADHDRTDSCINIGKLESLHPEFAKVLHDNFLELITDNCSDIKNHLSPNTEVIEK